MTRRDVTVLGISVGLLVLAVSCVLVSILVLDTPSSAKARRAAEAALSRSSVLTLYWAPAFCATNSQNEGCRDGHIARLGNGLFIHGLWPQPIQEAYCEVPSAVEQTTQSGDIDHLPPLELPEAIKAKIRPYFSQWEQAEHEWLKHGTCSGVSEEMYFEGIIALFTEVNRIADPVFRDAVSQTLTAETIQEHFDWALGPGAGARISLTCKDVDGISGSVILEMRVSLPRVESLLRGGALQPLATLLKKAPRLTPNCSAGRVIHSIKPDLPPGV